MDVLAVFEQAFGAQPQSLVKGNKSADRKDLLLFLAAREEVTSASRPAPTRSEIWPLVSHHPFNPQSLFGQSSREPLDQRALTILLAHDGLVVSDPTYDVERLFKEHRVEAALDHLNRLIHQVAEIQPLVVGGIVRFEPARPSFSDSERSAVLEAFGIDSSFTAFTNFADAKDSALSLSARGQWAYISQALEFAERLGVPLNNIATVDQAASSIETIGRALIHLSWQIAVCSKDATCDLATVSDLEENMLSNLLEAAFPVSSAVREGHARARHFRKVDIGLPNLQTLDLTIPDAIAIRSDDTFEEFRDALHSSMDEMDRILSSNPDGQPAANVAFEARMREASRRLRSDMPTTSFRDRVKEAAVPAGVGIVTTALTADAGPIAAGAGAGVISIATVLWDWFLGRNRPSGRAVAIRYSSHLGGVGVLRS